MVMTSEKELCLTAFRIFSKSTNHLYDISFFFYIARLLANVRFVLCKIPKYIFVSQFGEFLFRKRIKTFLLYIYLYAVLVSYKTYRIRRRTWELLLIYRNICVMCKLRWRSPSETNLYVNHIVCQQFLNCRN